MMKKDNTLVIALAIVALVLLFGGFGMMGFGGYGGMMHMYGNPTLCSNVGGIWCYIPIINMAFSFLVLIGVILLIVWLVKHLQEEKPRRRQIKYGKRS